MAITVTPTYVSPENTVKILTNAEGVSETNGTPEVFEAAFPAKDETCYILVTNGNVSAVQVCVLAAAEGNGFAESNCTLAKNAHCAIAVESGFVKNAGGKVCVKISPNAMNTVKGCGVTVSAVYSGVITH